MTFFAPGRWPLGLCDYGMNLESHQTQGRREGSAATRELSLLFPHTENDYFQVEAGVSHLPLELNGLSLLSSGKLETF